MRMTASTSTTSQELIAGRRHKWPASFALSRLVAPAAAHTAGCYVFKPSRPLRMAPMAAQSRGKCADLSRRAALTAAIMSTFAQRAFASAEPEAVAAAAVTPIYFGNGCFWGRQKDFVDTEKELGRKAEDISAVAGYAGGRGQSDGPVCYYYGKPGTIYEDLGHAEVVQLDIASDPAKAKQEMEKFATTYFKQFQKTSDGMQRLDPQDAGPAYRNVVGLPGGVKSPLFRILQEKNVNGMKLVAGSGNAAGDMAEGDRVNVVYVLDTSDAPFNLAEQYHQFHNGIGVPFGPEYTRRQKQVAQRSQRIRPTGCPELGGMFG